MDGRHDVADVDVEEHGSKSSRASPGLALERSSRADEARAARDRPARLGARRRSSRPVPPQCRRDQLGARGSRGPPPARPGIVGGGGGARHARRCSTSASTRSGYVAANRMLIGAPSEIPKQRRRVGAGGVHHRPHVVHPLLERRRLGDADRRGPSPRRSKLITRANEREPPGSELAGGASSQISSRWVVKPLTSTRSRSADRRTTW